MREEASNFVSVENRLEMTVSNRVITDGYCDPYPYCIIQDQNHYPTVFQQTK